MKLLKSILFFGIPIFVFSGCSDDNGGGGKEEEQSNVRKEIVMTRTQEQVAEADNSFAIKVTSQLMAQTSESENLVFSPLSLSMVLSIASNGAEGSTKQEILDALGYNGSDLAEANGLNCKLLEMLPTTDATTTMELHNALWIDGSVGKLRDDFSSTVSESYALPINTVDKLSSEATRRDINKWSYEKTHGLIPEILDDVLSPVSTYAITNATYFKGAWSTKFDSSKTRMDKFTNADGSESKVKMMNNTLVLSCLSDDGYSAVAIPYGNHSFCFIAVLPKEGTSLEDCIEELSPYAFKLLSTNTFSKKPLTFQCRRFPPQVCSTGLLKQ